MKPFIFFLFAGISMISCTNQPSPVKPEVSLSSGKIERYNNFPSKLITPRNVDVWLPENYSAKSSYSVLYMHDGQMLFDSTTTWNKQDWGVDETIGRLISSGEIQNTLVVAVWNAGNERYTDYFPKKSFDWLKEHADPSKVKQELRQGVDEFFQLDMKADLYLRFLVEELKPFIDSTYATKPEQRNTFIAGSSMGGLISMYAICEYPEVFYGAACISTHWVGGSPMDENPIPPSFFWYLENNLPSPENHKIYYDFGTETLDAHYEQYQTVVDSIMAKKNWSASNWITKKFAGDAHDERSWNRRLHIPLTFLMTE